MKNSKTFGNALLMLVAVIWGLAFVFQRVGMDDIEPVTFNAARMVSAAIFVSAVALVSDKLNKKRAETAPSEESADAVRERRRTTVIGGVLCGAFLAAASTVQQIGMVYTTAGKAGFITAMYIIFVPVIDLILFKKRSGVRLWISVALGVVGMYLLCASGGMSFSFGDLLVLLCALIFSGHILCCDRFAQKCDPVKLSAIQFITAGAILTVLAFIFEAPTVDKLLGAAVPILYCGIMSGGVGYTLQIIAQKRTDPTSASLIMSLESVFAALSGALLLNEQMSIPEILGCIIMFAAIILVQLPEKKKKG